MAMLAAFRDRRHGRLSTITILGPWAHVNEDGAAGTFASPQVATVRSDGWNGGWPFLRATSETGHSRRVGPPQAIPSSVAFILAFRPRRPAPEAPVRRGARPRSAKSPWLGELENVVSVWAYHSFSGEVEASNTPTIRLSYPLMPSPTFAHSTSLVGWLTNEASHGARDPSSPTPMPTILRYGIAFLSVAIAIGLDFFLLRQFEAFLDAVLFAVAATVWYAGTLASCACNCPFSPQPQLLVSASRFFLQPNKLCRSRLFNLLRILRLGCRLGQRRATTGRARPSSGPDELEAKE